MNGSGRLPIFSGLLEENEKCGNMLLEEVKPKIVYMLPMGQDLSKEGNRVSCRFTPSALLLKISVDVY